MRKTRKIITMSLAATLLLNAAISSQYVMAETEVATETDSDFMEDTAIDNLPSTGVINENIYGSSRDEVYSTTGIDLQAPKQASQVVYNIINPNGDHPIGEMEFVLDGKSAYVRAQKTSQRQPVPEDGIDNFAAYNISGLYYSWNEYKYFDLPFSRVFTITDSQNKVGCLIWQDAAAGILYNIGMTSQADTESLRDIALAMFNKVQGEEAAAGDEVEEEYPDYSKLSGWAYISYSDKYDVDVFFLAPTAASGEDYNMDLEDEKNRSAFTGLIAMEKGIYDDQANFIAPFYRQGTADIYSLSEDVREFCLGLAYIDVKDAFDYYLENINEDRGIILAGFSQGGDMVKRLLMDYPEIQEKLVAAYIIGWNITDEDLEAYPHLKMAEGEEDTGVIVSFCSEAPEQETSLIVPTTTKGINPLNWKTDETLAEKEENEGSCFPDSEGEIIVERPELCGAYLDEERGTLKVVDVTSEEYPARLSFLMDGDYHLYDYQFFYRNLEENVQKRIEKYLVEKNNENKN